MSDQGQVVVVITGPPRNTEDDEYVVKQFLSIPGRHIICGGTTARIVARQLGRKVRVDVNTCTEEVPPTGTIAGVDMVTEGTITLAKTLDLIRSDVPTDQLQKEVDGASRLARLLLDADEVRWLVGTALNPAHRDTNLPNESCRRLQLIQGLGRELCRRGKEVHTEYF